MEFISDDALIIIINFIKEIIIDNLFNEKLQETETNYIKTL
jgi:hypothetical protein